MCKLETVIEVISRDISVKELCEDAFERTWHCECVFEGSEPYFSMSQMQWYPGDDPEYEVEGYEEYIDYIVEQVCDIFTDSFSINVTDELEHLVRSNLVEICDIYLLDESDYWDKAIEEYLSNR